MVTTEYDLARQWRTAHNLSLDDLAELTGYSREAIYWFLRGETPPNRLKDPGDRAIAPWVFQRFKMACAGVEAQIKNGKPFDWGKSDAR